MDKQDEVLKFMEKVKSMEKGEKLDLSSDEDLSIAIMNLISIEEHLFFTANKTGKPQYYELLNEIRNMRKELLKKIIKDYEGEVWCISKHLLASSMRLMEVGTKMLSKGDKEEANGLFTKAYNLYSLFWGINLGLVKTDEMKELKETTEEENQVEFIDEKDKATSKGKINLFDKLGRFVQKAVDCCRE